MRAGIERISAVPGPESGPVDASLPRLQPLRRDGELCLFIQQPTELGGELSTLALRFLLPGSGHISEILPSEPQCHGSLLAKLCFLLLEGSHLRLDAYTRLRHSGDSRTSLFQPGCEPGQLLGHD
jgi:hypothetical protein